MAVMGPIKYGGLNTKSNTAAFGTAPVGDWMDVPLGQMTVCQDFNLISGALIARPATSIFSNQLGSASGIFGLMAWVDNANYTAKQTIFAVASDNKLYSHAWQYNATGAAFTDVTGTATIDTGTTDPFYQFASLNNILCGFGGSINSRPPFQITAYNGTASNLPGSPPSGNAIKVVNNFLFVGRQLGSSTTFSRVSWSNVGDPTTWTAGNYVDFRVNDGDRVTALGAIGTDLYIFKFNSIGRISTATVTVSGSVTLGPLETAVLGVGCYGPNCIDNLPDGRIVFLGSNLRLYVFDGFTLNTLSDMPLPAANVQPSLDEIPTLGTLPGIKVYPTHNQIIIYMTLNGANTGRVYVYDYQEQFWSQWTTLAPVVMATVPSFDFATPAGGYFNLPFSLIEGNSTTGKIVQLDESTVRAGPGNDIDNGAGTPTCTINVPLTGDFYDFIPRSLLLPIGVGATTVTGSPGGLTVTFGWDGTFLSSASFTMQALVIYPNTLVIPIPFKKEGSTTVRPTSLQIKISSQIMLHPFYLSDEVLN